MPTPNPTPPLPPLTLGVCSWSLQVTSVAELARKLGDLGVNATQIACGDPHHARWEEGDDFPRVARPTFGANGRKRVGSGSPFHRVGRRPLASRPSVRAIGSTSQTGAGVRAF